MRRLLCALAMTMLGCGRVGFDPLRDGDLGGSDGGGTCVAAVPATTFPGTVPCFDWLGSFRYSNATLTESNGSLTVTPMANAADAVGSCEHTNVTIGSAGAFTEVSQVLAGTTSETRLEVTWGGVTYFLGALGNMQRAGIVGDSVMFTGTTVSRWWRIRPAGGEIIFDTSPNGETWNQFGQLDATPTGTATLLVVARTPSAEPAPGTARFESVNVCP